MNADGTLFRRKVLGHWRRFGRHALPWRPPSLKLRRDGTVDPYAVLVSELMLQQTQVDRVIPFFRTFMKRFPTFRALARAALPDVLRAWQGLGYNRRALLLRRCAQAVVRDYGGHLPCSYDGLRSLPGVGPYTAGAVMAFAFDKPHPLIETNIRRVYIHHFFPRGRDIPDSRILPLVIRHLSSSNSPRTWYGALMDYGSWLSRRVPNPNRRSRSYVRQSPFGGSDRQVRGAVVKAILSGTSVTPGSVAREFDIPSARVARILARMERDGLLFRRGGRICLNPGS